MKLCNFSWIWFHEISWNWIFLLLSSKLFSRKNPWSYVFTVWKTRNSLSPKNISSNQLSKNLFSKTNYFTKFLPKMRERIPIITTLWIEFITYAVLRLFLKWVSRKSSWNRIFLLLIHRIMYVLQHAWVQLFLKLVS